MKNIQVLRNHLFEQLNRLADANYDADLDLEVKRSGAIIQVAETIIKTAEVENQFVAITKGTGSGFIPLIEGQSPHLITDDSKRPVQLFDADKGGNWIAKEPGPVIHSNSDNVNGKVQSTSSNGYSAD